MSEVKKVGGKQGKAADGEKAQKGRAPFVIKGAMNGTDSIVSDKGLLTAVPQAYNFDKNKPLNRKSFDNDGVFLNYRAASLKHRAGKMSALAVELEGRATKIAMYGDEKTRKKAQKLDRMKKLMAQLEAELAGAETK